MTSLQIQYFLKVAEKLSFSRTAEDMFVAQSSVSRQIHLLEEELGCTLFDRSVRNAIRLTEAGVAYRDCFRHAVSDLERVQTQGFSGEREEPLRLAVGVGANWDLTPQLLRFRQQVRLRYPHANLTFENLSFLQLRRLLEAGQLDVIFRTGTSIQQFEGLEVLDVAHLQPRAYVRKGLFCPAERSLQMSDFEGKTMLTLPEEEAPMSLQIVQKQFAANHVQVHPRRIPNRDSIYQALLLGDGFTVFDETMWLRTDPRLTWFPLEDQIPLSMVWSRSNQNPLIPLLSQVFLEETMSNDDSQLP